MAATTRRRSIAPRVWAASMRPPIRWCRRCRRRYCQESTLGSGRLGHGSLLEQQHLFRRDKSSHSATLPTRPGPILPPIPLSTACSRPRQPVNPSSNTYPGPTPSISANGNTNGIVWTLNHTATNGTRDPRGLRCDEPCQPALYAAMKTRPGTILEHQWSTLSRRSPTAKSMSAHLES